MTQKQKILQYLKQAGTDGLNSYDADYSLHIKQAPARIWDLKQDGYTIVTRTNADKSVNWILASSPVVKKIEAPVNDYSKYVFKDGRAYIPEEAKQESFI